MTQFWLSLWFKMAALPRLAFQTLAVVISAFLAVLVFVFGNERRSVTLTNLKMCFPNVSGLQRVLWCLHHMYLYLRTFLDRGWLWAGNAQVVQQRVHFENLDFLKAQLADGQPAILLAPHFLGLDAAWSRLTMEVDMVTMYSNQKNLVLNDLILKGRAAYGNPVLLSRQEGIRPLVQAMKKGRPLYYLPDMDFGEKDSVFVDFFGHKAATVTAVSRLSRLLKAKVIPVTTRYESGQYFVTVHPAIEGFPTDDDVESTQRVNHHIEVWVQKNVPQYLWLHKRFKTRPAGEAKIY
jgi:Kdo2-lipid IVA lauroyltransferase/acyltransferase